MLLFDLIIHLYTQPVVFSPTLMAAVPAIMERIRKAVFARVQSKGIISRAIFNLAFALKKRAVERGRSTPILDLVFKPVRQVSACQAKI